MKKIDFSKLDKNYIRTSLYIFSVFAFLILFEKVIGNLPLLANTAKGFIGNIMDIIFPFIIGFTLAYLMNPFIKFVEKHLENNFEYAKEKPKMVRASCILVNYFIVLGGGAWIILYLIPELETSFKTLAINLSTLLNYDLYNFFADIFEQFEFIDSEYIAEVFNELIQKCLVVFENIPQLINNIWQNLYVLGSFAFDFIMGLFIAFYLLYDKENSLEYTRKIIYSISKKEKADRLMYNSGRINKIFQNFIVGKAFDSLIIGILAFIGFSLLKAPVPSILSIIIGITNMIPYFGPFIGGTPVVILTAFASPMTAVWVTVYILVLQQFDGNYLGPKILGNSVDLSPILIILAVVVGGAVGGAVGMFIGVPVLATVKMFFTEYIDKKFNEKYSSK